MGIYILIPQKASALYEPPLQSASGLSEMSEPWLDEAVAGISGTRADMMSV